jgi:hypothetical protein
MVEIPIFKKLNTAVTNLNDWEILISHCMRDKNMEYILLTG